MSQLKWPRNRLLLALPASNLKRLMSQLELVPCERGRILLDADSILDDVFFPDSGVVSVVALYEDGSIIEMATFPLWRRYAKPTTCFSTPVAGQPPFFVNPQSGRLSRADLSLFTDGKDVRRWMCEAGRLTCLRVRRAG